jgi:hypothetical protein
VTELKDSQQVRLHRRHPDYRRKGEVLFVPLPRPRPDDLVAWTAGVVRDLFAAPKR